MTRWFVSKVALMFGVAALLMSSQAEASIIDQESTFFNSFIGPGSGQSQSFTPTLTGIDFATFSLARAPGDSSLAFVTLFEGDGVSGTLLSFTDTVFVIGDGTFANYQFNFASTVPLTPGAIYTLNLNAGFGLFAAEGSGNPYAVGQEYDSSGFAQPDYDLVFSEGMNASVVPEPSSCCLLLIGSVACMARRGRSRASKKTAA